MRQPSLRNRQTDTQIPSPKLRLVCDRRLVGMQHAHPDFLCPSKPTKFACTSCARFRARSLAPHTRCCLRNPGSKWVRPMAYSLCLGRTHTAGRAFSTRSLNTAQSLNLAHQSGITKNQLPIVHAQACQSKAETHVLQN